MQKMSEAKMKILRWMYGKTRKDKTKNECIQEHLGIASKCDKLRD